jgi:hypothetical protein
MLDLLLFVVYFLHRSHKVAFYLAFLVPNRPIGLNFVVVLFSLICSIFAGEICSIYNTKLSSWRVSKLVKERVTFVCHFGGFSVD